MDTPYFITIGQLLNEKTLIDLKSDTQIVEEGRRFYRECGEGVGSVSDVLKELHMDRRTLDVLKYAIKKDVSMFKMRHMSENAQVTLSYYNTHGLPKGALPAYIEDARRYFDRYVIMEAVESLEKGAGSDLIKQVIAAAGNIPIVTRVGYLYHGQFMSVNTDVECAELLRKLISYFESLGFVNVNQTLGGYIDSVIMIHATPDKVKKVSQKLRVCP